MAMIYAQIARDGDIKIPSPGIDEVNVLGDGRFQVKFTRGTFRQAPAVTVTAIASERGCGRTGTNRFLSIANLTASEVCLATFKASGSGASVARDFNLLAVGD